MRRLSPTPNLTDRVAVALAEDIVSGKYEVGDGLKSESELARTFGVSRNVMREAISRLKADGLVESKQGSGLFVLATQRQVTFQISAGSGADIEKILPIVEFRMGFEVEAAALAAMRATTEDLAAIRKAYAAMQTANEVHDLRAGIEADFEFHMWICTATHNPYYPRLFETFRSFLIENLSVSRENSSRRQNADAPAHAEHAAIMTAIASRDVAEARHAAKVHIDNTRSRLLACPRPPAAQANPEITEKVPGELARDERERR